MHLQSLESDCQWYEREERDMLLNQRSRLQGDVNSCNQTLAVYGMLRDIGFGLKEQKLLWHTIREIADANNISKEDAINKFFKDI
jgi:hypothetical protein